MTVVLDASALLAVLHNEPGADTVAALLEDAALSAVNWSEVLQKAAKRGVDVLHLRDDVEALGIRIAPFDADSAAATAALWPLTRNAGLSLGDRACLALAKASGATAVTADSAWAGVRVGVEIHVVR